MSDITTNGRGHIVPKGIESGLGTSAETAVEDYAPTFGGVLRVLKVRLWLIGLVAIVFAGAAVGYTLMQTPMYQASIKILVGQESGITDDPNVAIGLQTLTMTMAEGVGTRPIAEAAIQQQNLQTTPEIFLEQNLEVEQISNTQFIEVTYTDPYPERARRVANAVGEAFSKRISSNTDAITASVWESAATPREPVSPDPARNGLAGLMLGLMLGVGLAFLLEYRDDRWRSPEEVEQISGVPAYGIIPRFEAARGGRTRY